MTLAALGSNASRLSSAYGSASTAAPAGVAGKSSAAAGAAATGAGSIPFIRAVQQTLSDLGLDSGTTSSRASVAGRHDRTGESASSASAGTQASSQDVHRLMHDLLMAVHHEQASAAYASDKSVSSKDNYAASFSAGLQSVIQQASEATGADTGTTHPAVLAVKTDFRKLVNDLRAQTGNAASQYPSLQTFLNSLSSNLQSQMADSAAVGGLINTAA